MKFLNTILILFLSFHSLKAQLFTYPEGLRTGIPHNDDFTVMVRVKGGEWKETFEYKVQVDMDRVQDASMVQFDMNEPVEVMVKKNNGLIQTVDIRPKSKSIKYEKVGNCIFFTIDKPQYLSVEFNVFVSLSFQRTPLRFRVRPLTHATGRVEDYIQSLVNWLLPSVLLQSPSFVGALDLIGNPANLVISLYQSAVNVFRNPISAVAHCFCNEV